MSGADLTAWRRDTPGADVVVHLNNAGAALMPRPVIEAQVGHLELEARMGGYEAADARAAEIATGYDDLGRLIGAGASNVAVVGSATAGFVQALSAVDFAPGDRLVTSRCDYTSNQIQYLALARRRGVEILHAADLPEGGVDPGSVDELLGRGRCRLVAVSWIPTNSGVVQDVEAVGAVAERRGVPYLVDACQAVGQLEIDVGRLRCDYLSATARKFLRGPRGIGFLYVSDRALARGDYPLHVDMRGAGWVAADRFEPVRSARRFEEWEQGYASVLGQAAAAGYALRVGIETARRRAWALAERLRDGLAALPGARVLDQGRTRCAIVTVAFEDRDAAGLVRGLAARGINTVLTRREYGIYDFDAKGVAAAVRLSPHYYNTEDEVDQAVEALRELAVDGPAGRRAVLT